MLFVFVCLVATVIGYPQLPLKTWDKPIVHSVKSTPYSCQQLESLNYDVDSNPQMPYQRGIRSIVQRSVPILEFSGKNEMDTKISEPFRRKIRSAISSTIPLFAGTEGSNNGPPAQTIVPVFITQAEDESAIPFVRNIQSGIDSQYPHILNTETGNYNLQGIRNTRSTVEKGVVPVFGNGEHSIAENNDLGWKIAGSVNENSLNVGTGNNLHGMRNIRSTVEKGVVPVFGNAEHLTVGNADLDWKIAGSVNENSLNTETGNYNWHGMRNIRSPVEKEGVPVFGNGEHLTVGKAYLDGKIVQSVNENPLNMETGYNNLLGIRNTRSILEKGVLPVFGNAEHLTFGNVDLDGKIVPLNMETGNYKFHGIRNIRSPLEKGVLPVFGNAEHLTVGKDYLDGKIVQSVNENPLNMETGNYNLYGMRNIRSILEKGVVPVVGNVDLDGKIVGSVNEKPLNMETGYYNSYGIRNTRSTMEKGGVPVVGNADLDGKIVGSVNENPLNMETGFYNLYGMRNTRSTLEKGAVPVFGNADYLTVGNTGLGGRIVRSVNENPLNMETGNYNLYGMRNTRSTLKKGVLPGFKNAEHLTFGNSDLGWRIARSVNKNSLNTETENYGNYNSENFGNYKSYGMRNTRSILEKGVVPVLGNADHLTVGNADLGWKIARSVNENSLTFQPQLMEHIKMNTKGKHKHKHLNEQNFMENSQQIYGVYMVNDGEEAAAEKINLNGKNEIKEKLFSGNNEKQNTENFGKMLEQIKLMMVQDPVLIKDLYYAKGEQNPAPEVTKPGNQQFVTETSETGIFETTSPVSDELIKMPETTIYKDYTTEKDEKA